VRSKHSSDIKRGIFLLEDLSKTGPEQYKRDCIYYLAIGNAKIKVCYYYYCFLFITEMFNGCYTDIKFGNTKLILSYTTGIQQGCRVH
jgi:hypothetical protein